MAVFRWIVLSTLALVAAYLLVLGPRPAASRPVDKVTVRYWEKWGGHEEEQMRVIVNDFNRTVGAEKKIHVEYLSMSNVNQKTLVATAAGVPPDVAGLWDGQVAQWASIDALEPLDDLAKEAGITETFYKPVYWNACRYEGKLVALISTPSAVLLHYNKDMFAAKADALRAAGCDPARAPRTIEELDRYARALDERDAKGNLLVAGYLPAEPGWYRGHTPLWFGGRVFDGKRGTFTLTSAECVKAFEWWQSYSKRLGKDALTEFRSGMGNFSSPQNPFLVGKVAMVQQGPWMANYIQINKPEWNNPELKTLDPKDPAYKTKVDAMTEAYFKLPASKRRELAGWGVAPFPSVYSDAVVAEKGVSDADVVKKLVAEGVAHVGFDTLVIPKGAAHRKEAFEFIAYINRKEVMRKLCALHCKNSPLREVDPTWFDSHPNPYIDQFETMAGSRRASSVPPVPTWPEVTAELDAMIDRITLMTQTPAEALAGVQARVQAAFDKFREREALRRAREAGR